MKIKRKTAKSVKRETHIRVYKGDKSYLEYIRKKHGKKSLKDALHFVLSKTRTRRIV